MRKQFSKWRKVAVAPVLASFLLLAGCQKTEIVGDLNTALGAIQVALPILEAGGLLSGPAGIWISVAAAAVNSAATEVASSDTALNKAEFVNADISKAISELPATQSVPANVQPKLAAIQAALQAILYDVQQSQGQRLSARVAANPHLSIDKNERTKLKNIAAEAAAISAAVKR